MNDMLSANKYYKRPNKFGSNEFIVCHYAGEVAYDINGFIEKNRDTLSEVINKALS
jgi:myosin-5